MHAAALERLALKGDLECRISRLIFDAE